MRPYDEIWQGDCMREDAMRERNHNNRYPDYSIPPISTRRFAWGSLAAVAAIVGLTVVALLFA